MTDAVIDRASGIGDAAAEPQVDVAQGCGTKGAVPGAISVVVFTALHHVTIKQHLADVRRHAGAGRDSAASRRQSSISGRSLPDSVEWISELDPSAVMSGGCGDLSDCVRSKTLPMRSVVRSPRNLLRQMNGGSS